MANKRPQLKFHHDIKIVDIDKVIPNDYNPNYLPAYIYAQRQEQLKEEGFVGAIIVRENDEKKDNYIIIDGEQSWRLAKEEGYKQIPIIVLDKSKPEAMISTINFNRLHGEFDTIKLARVVAELNKYYTIEELEKKLGYSNQELQVIRSFLIEETVDLKEPSPVVLEEREESRIFKVILNKNQYDKLRYAIKKTKKDNDADAITEIVQNYVNIKIS